MKLLAAVLCLFLLVGCAEKQEEPTTPTEESGQSLHVSGHPLETQTSGIMEVFPIEETDPQGLRSLGTDVVLWGESGISLYTGSGLRKAAQASGRPVLGAAEGRLFVYDEAARQILALDATLSPQSAWDLPEGTLGLPGVSPDGKTFYFLQQDGLYLLDTELGTQRGLRDNMAVRSGSVRCLENGQALLVHLTDPNGAENTLLVSAQDGQSIEEALCPKDAAVTPEGIALGASPGAFSRILLLGAEPQRLVTRSGETCLGFLPELSAALGLTLDELFESSAETHLRRIQQRMENEPRMSMETFRQAESQLRQDALETEYRPRCLTLLAELYNHMAEGFRARAEEAAREAIHSNLLRAVSHDLRTPLTAINGWAETLQSGELTDPRDVQKGMDIIVSEAHRLTNMVEELLDFSKMTDGRFTLQVEDTDLQAELEDAVYTYRELFRQDGISLEYTSDKALYDEPITGDPERLKQVFCNVLDNAAKHGGSGKRIVVHLTQEDGTYIITIRDFGPGIPEAELPYVKQKFYKGSSRARGSGIGLAVCDEIVHLHGGQFDIGNAEGGGTVVTIRLPLKRETEKEL